MFEKLYFCGVLSLCLAVCFQSVKTAEEDQYAVDQYSYARPFAAAEAIETYDEEESHQSLYVDYGFLNE